MILYSLTFLSLRIIRYRIFRRRVIRIVIVTTLIIVLVFVVMNITVIVPIYIMFGSDTILVINKPFVVNISDSIIRQQ